MTEIQEEILRDKTYTPFCRSSYCSGQNPQTIFHRDQFECRACGWRTNYEEEFIEEYRITYNK